MSPVTIDMDMVEAEGKMLNNNKAPETPGIMEEEVVVVEEDLTERILLRDSKIIDR